MKPALIHHPIKRKLPPSGCAREWHTSSTLRQDKYESIGRFYGILPIRRQPVSLTRGVTIHQAASGFMEIILTILPLGSIADLFRIALCG
jgi:hypothetical protein